MKIVTKTFETRDSKGNPLKLCEYQVKHRFLFWTWYTDITNKPILVGMFNE